MSRRCCRCPRCASASPAWAPSPPANLPPSSPRASRPNTTAGATWCARRTSKRIERVLANARMYSVTPASTEAWRAVINWVTREAAVPVEFVEHAPPKLLSDLWSRPDLGVVQMCGLPASLRSPSPIVLAAPLPSPPRYGGKAVYMSDLAVRADSKFQTLDDTFGGVAGYTLKDSQSGYFAFRTLLLTKYPIARYRKIAGGLMNARGIVKALMAGDIDVGPLHAYVCDPIQSREPGIATPNPVSAPPYP